MESMQTPQSIHYAEVMARFITMFINGQVLIFFNYIIIFYHRYAFYLFWNFFFDKAFGHIDRMFLIRIQNEIGSQWTIIDDDLNVHQVTYNMNFHNLMII